MANEIVEVLKIVSFQFTHNWISVLSYRVETLHEHSLLVTLQCRRKLSPMNVVHFSKDQISCFEIKCYSASKVYMHNLLFSIYIAS